MTENRIAAQKQPSGIDNVLALTFKQFIGPAAVNRLAFLDQFHLVVGSVEARRGSRLDHLGRAPPRLGKLQSYLIEPGRRHQFAIAIGNIGKPRQQ